MSDLHIALQSGFRNDSVVVVVNKREIFKKSGVTTNLVISLADKVDVSVEGRKAEITVEVTSRNTSRSIAVTVAETPFVGASIEDDGTVQIAPSKLPFTYF